MTSRRGMPSGVYYVCYRCGSYTCVPDNDRADDAVVDKGWELAGDSRAYCPDCRREPVESKPAIVDVPLPFDGETM